MSDYAKYTKQVNMVLDYINAHINEDLDIKSLAQNTYLSTYHFTVYLRRQWANRWLNMSCAGVWNLRRYSCGTMWKSPS